MEKAFDTSVEAGLGVEQKPTQLHRVLVFVKGASKPVLFENVLWWNVGQGGELQIQFQDNSATILATGQWREADVESH